MTVDNVYNVPKSQWRKWAGLGQQTFNTVYEELVLNQAVMKHPAAPQLDVAHWETFAWNAAFTAASAATKAAHGRR